MVRNAETVVVTGATGMQGRPIVTKLEATGYSVRALSRKGMVSASHDVQYVRGDLTDVESLQTGFEGADAIVALLPLIFDVNTVKHFARNLVEAAKKANVRRVVFDTSAPVPPAPVQVAAVDTKFAAERIFLDAGLDLTIIRPTIYMGNLAAPWVAPRVVGDGIIAYPLSASVRCAWISWEDVASCILAALGDPSTIGKTYDVGGQESLDGTSVAKAFEAARGSRHEYAPVPLDIFEAQLSQAIGSDGGREIAGLYHWFNSEGAEFLSPGEKATTALGVVPTTMREWAKQVPWEKIAE